MPKTVSRALGKPFFKASEFLTFIAMECSCPEGTRLYCKVCKENLCGRHYSLNEEEVDPIPGLVIDIRTEEEERNSRTVPFKMAALNFAKPI